MARKEKFNYFDAFVKSSEYAVEYADRLVKYFEKNLDLQKEGRDPNPHYAIEAYREFHALESAADTVKHDITTNLATEFLSPIEREDILILADHLDNICDDLDSVLQRMYMFDLHCISEACLDMAKVVAKATKAVHAACVEFCNFKKSKSLHDLIVQVADCEEEGDKIYIQATHEVFKKVHSSSEEVDAFGISTVLTSLEKCCDACEAAADTMATTAIKNS